MSITSNSHIKSINKDGTVVNYLILEGYAIANFDDNAGNYPQYSGYLDQDGNYYIMRESKLGNVSTYEYSSGSSAYATAWTNRAAETYQVFNVEF